MNEPTDMTAAAVTAKHPLSQDPTREPPAKVIIQQNISSRLTKTNAATEDNLDVLVAKFFYLCNIPVTVPDYPGFSVGLSLIVSDELKSQMKHHLKDQTVTLVEDGWSNIHNDPVLVITVQKRFNQAVT